MSLPRACALLRTLILATIALLGAVPARADELRLAVAANLAGPMQALGPAFEQASGHRLSVSLGATGKLYAQIRNGAPFDALMSADEETPARLEAEGLAVPGTRRTYAIGRLVLWSARPGVVDDAGEVLRHGRFSRLALANPRLAPYGRAAREALEALGHFKNLEPRFVVAESVTQAHQFVATGNAELGFVARSQLTQAGRWAGGSHWTVPAKLHTPLRQDAVVLQPGRGSAAAGAWMAWLASPAARALLQSHGYELPG